MKMNFLSGRYLVMLTLLVLCSSFMHTGKRVDVNLKGAWKMEYDGHEHILLFVDGYFSHVDFSKDSKEFFLSQGGTYEVKDNNVVIKSEFNSEGKEEVGDSKTYPVSVSGDVLNTEVNGNNISWQRIDDGSGPLAGAWRITGRMENDKLTTVNSGARKTLKLLTGSRFQWIAMNTETKEFFGTGGGTYTFTNGKYTENIEFFSRDNSRVGMSLGFDGKIDKGQWLHSGLSSKGEKINEVWGKVK